MNNIHIIECTCEMIHKNVQFRSGFNRDYFKSYTY